MKEQTNQSNEKDIAYIITDNFNAPHIEQLIKLLQINSVPYQLQKDQDSLGVTLDRRYFVIVDNIMGATKLGPWFSSLLLFIVGYPKRGNNKKNHYCTQALQVIGKYNQFRELPQFVVKSYLSSSIASKQMLKSSKSAISLASNSRALSESSNETKPKVSEIVKQKFQINQKSKLLLFLSEGDKMFNKWLLKIAANNPKKFEIVQNLSEFNLTLSVCKSKQNYVLMNVTQYEHIPKEHLKNVGILIFSNGAVVSQNLQNIVAICNCKNQIIATIRDLGFQVLSLKDIDKSIVKYGNPFAKQQKPRSNKKILWQKQETQVNKNIAMSQQSASSDQYFIKVSAESCRSNKFAQSAPANCYKVPLPQMSRQDSASIQFQPPKQKKRVSIESNCKNNKQIVGILPISAISEIKQQKPKKFKNQKLTKSQSVWNNIKKQDKQDQNVNTFSDTIKINMQTPDNSKPPLRIKKMKASKSVYQKIQTNKLDQIIPIAQQGITGIKTVKVQPQVQVARNFQDSSSFDQSATQKHVLNSSCASLALKSSQKQTNILQFPQTFDLDLGTNSKNSKFMQKQKIKQNETNNKQNKPKPIRMLKIGQRTRKLQKQCASLKKDPVITYRMRVLGVQQSNVIQVFNGQYQISQISSQIKQNIQSEHALLWKDFNFQISTSRNHIVNNFMPNSLFDKCFCFVSELKNIIQSCDKKAITLFLDQLQVQKYLSVVQQLWNIKKFVNIYVFQTQGSKKERFLQQISSITGNKMFAKIRSIIKPIIYDASLNTGAQVTRQLCRWFTDQQSLST